jgi:hypothetical protein
MYTETQNISMGMWQSEKSRFFILLAKDPFWDEDMLFREKSDNEHF